MSKKEIESFYYCDVCGAEIKNIDESNRFSYAEGWQSGIHYGRHENQGHVCEKCKKSKLRRFLALKFIKDTKAT